MTSRITLVVLLLALGLTSVAADRLLSPFLGPTLATTGYGKAATQPGPRGYPRQTVDSDGVIVRIERKPSRIVSQYWSIDEYLYAVVPPERVVGVSESAYLPNVSNVLHQVLRFQPRVASTPENVLRLHPDLIVVSSSSSSDLTSLLRTTGIPVYRMFINFTTLAQIEEYIRLTGYLTGEDDAAETAAKKFHEDIERAKSMRPANVRPPRILGMGGQYSYGANTLFNDVVRAVGGVNIAAENGLVGYDLVTGEQIARWNPEWIVAGADHDAMEQTRARILADPAVALTEAGKRGQILVLENRTFLPMSPFSTIRATALAEALWR